MNNKIIVDLEHLKQIIEHFEKKPINNEKLTTHKEVFVNGLELIIYRGGLNE